MTERTIQTNIKIDQLITMSLNGLDGLFLRPHKDKAKKLYKQLIDGEVVDFGNLTFKEQHIPAMKMRLALDHSQFRGHITFHLFRTVLLQMMKNVARKLERKENLNIFSDDKNQEIIALTPGVIQHEGNINVLALGIVSQHQAALIKLQFLDPDQFRKQGGDSVAAEAVAAEEGEATDESSASS